MAGSPQYLALLDTVRPGIASYKALDLAWDLLVDRPHERSSYERIASITFAIIAKERELEWAELINDAKQLHIDKNAGYAGADNPDPWANFRMCQAFGIGPVDGILVRMSDKYIRITNLRKDASNERVGESIYDSLRDLGAYALIALCVWEDDLKYRS